jgi:hypothetical protein
VFWTCLLLFVLGHAAAVAWFRSGRPWVGVLLVAWLWVTADAAVLLRFLFDPPLPAWESCAWAMAVGAALASSHVAWLLLRRRTARAQEQRVARYREGLIAHMGNDARTAVSRFRWLVRKDPWDLDSWAALQMVAESVPRAAKPAAVTRPAKERGAVREKAVRRSS